MNVGNLVGFYLALEIETENAEKNIHNETKGVKNNDSKTIVYMG
ncbi:hypothetical protein ACDX78_21190 [Virgibacillus oceani]